MTALYRYYDAEDELLYVGISGNLLGRVGQHEAKPWIETTTRISVEWFKARRQAARAEQRAIITESPVYNETNEGARCTFEMLANVPEEQRSQVDAAYVAECYSIPLTRATRWIRELNRSGIAKLRVSA